VSSSSRSGELVWAPAPGDLSRPPARHQTVPVRHVPQPPDTPLGQLYVWDPWPVLDAEGHLADVHGQEWWVALTAPRDLHPEARHDHARMRLLSRGPDGWHDLGPLFPDGASPGSREWSGTAVFDAASSRLLVLYTAAGVRDEPRRSFRQRIFQTQADVRAGRVAGWDTHTEVVAAAPPYLPADEVTSATGLCRAFRDPFYFRDPQDGVEYLVFAASLPDAEQQHAGAIGLASRRHGTWELQPSLLVAAGVNRELERPHLLFQDGHYYLLFSTHGQSFHPRHPGRTGLYGLSSPAVGGPYQSLNGSGLVLANPEHAPSARYAWQVLSDGQVVSFTNYPSHVHGPLEDAAFGGTIAPFLQLVLSPGQTRLETDTALEATA
jgi:levansucrase